VRFNLRICAWLVRRSLVGAFDDNCFGIAKGVAYSALLSFFPVLASSAAILVQTRAQFVSRTIEDAVSGIIAEIVPPGTEDLVLQQFRITGARPLSVLVVAGLISLWAASGAIKSLIEGFSAAYRIPRDRGFLRLCCVSIGMVLLSAVPLVCASFAIFFGSHVEITVLHWMKVDPLLSPLSWVARLASRGARYTLAVTTLGLVACVLYYFGPYRKQRWRFVWPGAVLASFLWLGATSGFAWYVRHLANYNVMYGSIGAGIAILVWMYIMAVISLIGCEFNAEYERAAAGLAAHPLQSQL
jgi:membrane protein